MTVGYAAEIRADLGAAHRRAWDRLAHAGSWWTGAERVAIAAETRHAPSCRLCARRKEALSPHAVTGSHDHLGALPDAAVEAIHAIVAHPSRLTRRWYDGVLAGGLSDGHYVELVGVVAQVTAVDTFCRGIGVAPHPLPAPAPGAPTGYRPAEAKQNDAWVPNIADGEQGAAEADLFGPRRSNIRRALTLVPDEARGFFDLVETQYLPGPAMMDFAREYRAISHAQIELVAARISALNQCFY